MAHYTGAGSQIPTIQDGLIERLTMRVLRSLNVDTAGNLRVAPASTPNMTTLTTVTNVTNITNWGQRTALAITQQESNIGFQQGYRRNLVRS